MAATVDGKKPGSSLGLYPLSWWSRSSLLALTGCLAAALLVYLPVLGGGFVWDDHALVLRDPLLRSWRHIFESFAHFLFLDATPADFYRPMQRLTFLLDYQIAGFSPWMYHLSSVVWHAAAAWMLWHFIMALARRSEIASGNTAAWAWLAVLVWLVHPLHSSAVAYIAGRADPIAATFVFAACAVVVRNLERQGFSRLAGWCALFLLALFAMLSKEAGLVVLLLVPLILLSLKPRALAEAGVALICAGLIYGALRLAAEKTPPPPADVVAAPGDVLLRAVGEYTFLAVWPATLRMERSAVLPADADGGERAFHWTAVTIGLLMCGGVGVLLVAGRRRIWAIPLLLTVVAYLPVSGIRMLNATIAEHWLYIPSGFLAAAAGLALMGATRQPVPRRWVALGLAAIVLALGARTLLRSEDWSNERSFFESTLRDGGATSRVYLNLAQVETRDGNLEAAGGFLKQALAIHPKLGFIRMNLGNLEMRRGNFDPARLYYAAAWSDPLVRASVLTSLAVLEWRETGSDQTGRLLQAVRLEPKNWAVRERFVRWLAARGDLETAYRSLVEFMETGGYRAEAWFLLGELCEQMNHPDIAFKAYQNALDRDVHHKRAEAAILRLHQK